jgi:hypothetical protein
VPNRSGLGGDELDRHPLDRHADRAALGLLHDRDDLRQRGEARQHGRGIRGGADHREVLAGVAPAPHVAGRLAAEADRHAPDQLPGAVEQQAALRSAGPSRASASSSWASRLGPIPGTVRSRPAAAASRSSPAVLTPSARAISSERAAPSPR